MFVDQRKLFYSEINNLFHKYNKAVSFWSSRLLHSRGKSQENFTSKHEITKNKEPIH